MPVVWLKLPKSFELEDGRPKKCIHCGSQVLQRWGKVSKPVRDIKQKLAEVYRYRCVECSRTFRHYPRGVDRSDKSRRIRQVAGLAWVMGLSAREVVDIFSILGVELSHSTVWREGQSLSEKMGGGDPTRNGKKYAIDRSYIHKVSTKMGVVVALDLGDDRKVVLGTLDEHNPRVVKSWMERFIEGVNIEVSVLDTGTLDYYHPGKIIQQVIVESSG